jgi:arabinogalactan oligomer/maltooligosaccharide transport system permease protein
MSGARVAAFVGLMAFVAGPVAAEDRGLPDAVAGQNDVQVAGEVAPASEARPEVVLWHAYRADEAAVIDEIVADINARDGELRIKVLAVPYDAYLDKITAAIPRGRGPDIFIAAHDRIGDWAEANTIQPVDDVVDVQTASSLVPGLLPAMLYRGHVYGVPLAFKSVALWRNTRRVPDAPATLDALVEEAKKQTVRTGDQTVYGLVYENRDLYYHAPFLFGFGGRLFGEDGRPTLDDAANIASIDKVQTIARLGVVPQEVSGTLTVSLFNDEKAAFIVTGPWSRGEVAASVPFAISALPDVVDPAGVRRPMRPLLTVEAAFLSGQTQKRELAIRVARMLADDDRSAQRMKRALQPVARAAAWDRLARGDLGVSAQDAAFLRGFRDQLATAVPTPNTPAMKALWGPFNLALGETMGQGTAASTTLKAAQEKLQGVLAEVDKPEQPSRGQAGFAFFVVVLFVVLIAWILSATLKAGGPRAIARGMRDNGPAYAYVAPAMLGTGVLVLLPFVVGVGMGFYRHAWGRYTFVGLDNFVAILTGADASFFRTLGVTVLWTGSNVLLHVTIGVLLALLLSQARLRFRAVYRVLFIVPWAVPSYITALIWKGMFHPEFGAVNALLGTPGMSWMNDFWSAFAANLITNTWLGFPFMMVTALGGLTAIPKDLYEAAALDGAGPWKRFTSITLPLLRPTLAPAIVLGTVWTFNMFNVIYLVSGGAPGGQTDILVTEAFRWAFERGQGGAFGLAAAYSTLIFLMLLAYNTAASRVTKAMRAEQ